MAMKHYKLRFFKFRLFVLFILLVLLVVQLRAIPQLILSNEPPKQINDAYLDKIEPGEEVGGTLTHIEGNFDSDYTDIDQQINNYVVLTPANKLVLFRTMAGTQLDADMKRLMKGEIEYVRYRGKSAVIHPSRKLVFDVYVISNLSNGYLSSLKLDTNSIRYIEIDVIDDKSKIPEKYIIASIVIAVLLLIAIVWLSIKPINNFIYNVLVYKGKITPEWKIKKEDIKIELEGEYKNGANDEGYFYVGKDDYENKDENISGNADVNAKNTSANDTKPDTASDAGDEYISTGPMRAYDEDFFYTKGADEDGNFFVNSEEDHSEYHGHDKYHY